MKAATNRAREAMAAWVKQQLESRRLRHVGARVVARLSAGVFRVALLQLTAALPRTPPPETPRES